MCYLLLPFLFFVTMTRPAREGLVCGVKFFLEFLGGCSVCVLESVLVSAVVSGSV